MKKYFSVTIQEIADWLHIPVWLFFLITIPLGTVLYDLIKKLLKSF